MAAFLTYLMESGSGLLLFYLCYKVLLSRETFFRLNRFLLLGGVAVCLLLPLCPLRISGDMAALRERCLPLEKSGGMLQWLQAGRTQAIDLTSLPPATVSVKEERGTDAVPATGGEAAFSWLPLLTGIYMTGGGMVAVWLLCASVRMVRLLRSGRRTKTGKYTLVLVREEVCPFSWGKIIVMNENDFREQGEQILLHEQMHAGKKHTLDILLMEACLVLQWFNPAMWLLKRELQDVHEYEADHSVLEHGIDATQYQLLLVKKAVGAKLYAVANNFNHSKLKNRITMMLKEKSNGWARFKVMMLVPPLAFLMLAFARPVATEKLPEEKTAAQGSSWTEEFFREEMRRNGGDKYSLEWKELKKNFGDNVCQVLVNSKGIVNVDGKFVANADLKDHLKKVLVDHLSSTPVFMTLQKDVLTPSEDYRRVLDAIGQAYQEARASAQGDPDRVCPVRLGFIEDKDTWNVRK